MPLLAIPFKPNSYEWHFLAKDRVLADQMEYLSTQFRADRDWAINGLEKQDTKERNQVGNLLNLCSSD